MEDRVTGRTLEHVLILHPARKEEEDTRTPSLPDIPWYVLQLPPYCQAPWPVPPLVPCAPGVAAPAQAAYPGVPMLTAHYTYPGGGFVPNPDYPQGQKDHDNVTRYWSWDPTFRLLFPTASSAPLLSIPQPAPLPPVSYAWLNFINDVTATVAKYTTVPTADIRATVTPLLDATTYGALYGRIDVPGAPVPPFIASSGSGVLVWDDRPQPSPPLAQMPDGPTGDGINDVIMLQSRRLSPPTTTGIGGAVSMIVDPVSGRIDECDVIFEGAFFTDASGLGTPSIPTETTAFAHELGHAFGLDHTNLHPGGAPSTSPNPAPAFGFPASYAQYTVPAVAAEYPGMVSQITNFAGTSYVALPIHTDEAVGLSRIYPLAAPYTDATGVARAPLINTTATFRGHTRTGAFAPDPLRNVYPFERPAGTPLVLASYDSRRPLVGTVSGLARLSRADVVGVPGGTAAFDLIGVPAGPLPAPGTPPPQYDIVVESMQSLGMTSIDPTAPGVGPGPSEWWWEAFLNGSGSNLPSAATPVQYITASNDAILSGSLGSQTVVVGSFAVVQGTIIDVNLTDPGTGAMLHEPNTTRPVVELLPRSRPQPTDNVTITVMHNLPLASVTLTANGGSVPVPAGVPVTPNRTQYVIPASSILPPGGGPVLVTCRAKEDAGVLGPGPVYAIGVNEVQW